MRTEMLHMNLWENEHFEREREKLYAGNVFIRHGHTITWAGQCEGMDGQCIFT